MKNNLTPFPGTTGEDPTITLPESDADTTKLYAFERQVMDRLQRLLNGEGREQASISFDGPEAMREKFKQVLLKILARNKKVAHRSRSILRVSHPEMTGEEQVPFLRERSELPQITLHSASGAELEMMHSLGSTFPELLDARNAINSVKLETKGAYLF